MRELGTLTELLNIRFEEDAERQAYVFVPGKAKPPQSLTYRELGRRCGGIGEALLDVTCEGDRALLVYPAGLGFVEGFLACVRAGRVAVPVGTIKPNRAGNHVERIVRNCSPKVILTERGYYESLLSKGWLGETLSALPVLFTDEVHDGDASKVRVDVESRTLAFLQYTSGSTREPRGVMISHGNLMANMTLLNRGFSLRREDVAFGWLPFFHDMGLIGHVLQMLHLGSTSVLMPPLHFLAQPISWLRGITDYRATLSGAPNFAFDLCVDRISESERQTLDLSSWRVAYNGAEPVSARTMRRFIEAFAPYGLDAAAVSPCYGMAECTLFVAAAASGLGVIGTTREALAEGSPLAAPGEEAELVSCGQPLASEEVVIVDPEQGCEVPVGQVGEIWVAGPHVAHGYWNDEPCNAESFGQRLPRREAGFLRTGDLGFVDAVGQLFITGRSKEVVIVRGKNHYPQDVEDTVQGAVPATVTHRGALFTRMRGGSEDITLVQELRRGTPAQEYPSIAARIREAVLEQHGFSVDTVILARIGAIPLTSSGKIQRLKCRAEVEAGKLDVLWRSDREPATVRSDSADTQAVPGHENHDAASPVEIVAKLGELIRKFSPRAGLVVDPHGSFAQYGLDSVRSVALLQELGTWLGREVAPTLVWEYPSVAELAEYLARGACGETQGLATGLDAAVPGAPSIRAASALTCSVSGTGHDPTRGDVRESAQRPKLSLLFFASESREGEQAGYRLFLEASRLADRGGLHAIWVPERHFHAFGGLYPSPSVLAAALARETQHVRLRSGSVVLPLHSPVRVAEEWALVDNLSRGRVDLGFAQGWNANDFVLAPEAYENRKELLFSGVDMVRKLWRGETLELPNGRGEPASVQLFPSPVQRDLQVWITCSGADERFIEAGRLGYNVLTALLFQPSEELFRKIELYRAARREAGHLGRGEVTVMLHTYVHPDAAHVRAVARAPFIRYLEESTTLWRQEADALADLSPADRDRALDYAYERYVRTTSLIGTPEFAAQTCETLRRNGVDEVACLIDFGLPLEEVLQSVARIASLATGREVTWQGGPGAQLAGKDASVGTVTQEPIAVVGIAARVAGAEDVETLWNDLKRGHDLVGPMPPERWPGAPSLDSAPRAGWLPKVDLFAAEFFKVSPHEATMMDPQQRLFLETAWACVQDAGYSGPELAGTRTAVYVGAADAGYHNHFRQSGIAPDPYMLAGNTVCTLPARISYYLDLRGPCLVVDTACSSSLVAIHEACRALLTGECDMALAGGVSLTLTPDLFLVAGTAGMLSPDGKCRTFDAGANGYVPGEGVGVVLLKPLSAALRDGNHIYGLVRGSAINHDGRTNGITAPNPAAQVAVSREAMARAGLEPRDMGYVECHGTGTPLGDPIEFKALAQVYSDRPGTLPIGSVKSNTGHLLAAAGVTSFLKALLSLKHRLFVPSLHFERPNPNLDYHNAVVQVMTDCAPWETRGTRRAAVSSFGHSGTNCTVILEEFCSDGHPSSTELQLCVVSGRTHEELEAYMTRLAKFLGNRRDLSIASVARTLAVGRAVYPCRAAFGVRSTLELAAAMRDALGSGKFSRASEGPRFGLLEERGDARTSEVARAASQFLAGETPDWDNLMTTRQLVSLPPYPLRRTSHWPARMDEQHAPAIADRGSDPSWGLGVRKVVVPAVGAAIGTSASTVERESNPRAADAPLATTQPGSTVREELTRLMSSMLRCNVEDVDADARFLDLGADSIVLMDVVAHIQSSYAIEIPVADLFERIDTLNKLLAWMGRAIDARPSQVSVAARSEVAASVSRQESNDPNGSTAQSTMLPTWAASNGQSIEVDATLVEAYCQRTKRSKELARTGRAVLADNRASAGFRVAAKELVYPIVAEQGDGAYVTDIDGNRYLDITMGFGVHLFGHNPAFVREALQKSIERGFVLGPNSPIAADVAKRIARLTGHERVAFCNSGTEAVMSALRLARTYTGRSKVAVFAHSYHGHSDGVLGYPAVGKTLPAVPGVPEGAVAATVVVPGYGEAHCLQTLEGLTDLAAVIVEPIQARDPGHQPLEFLARLREWTRKRGVVLIFDEMITGFRIAAGGIQQVLGFRADLTTYGKVVGGGLPIGVIAGVGAIMDGIDGGQWQYGDDSAPHAKTTFFAGTFSKHPLVLASAQAALVHIEAAGDVLYPELNRIAEAAKAELDEAFRRVGYPGEVRNYGSLFRFFLKGKQDLFFYRLMMNGVYVWEGRNCFLSTQHGRAQVAELAAAVRDAVAAPATIVDVAAQSGTPPRAGAFPSLDSQRQLWALGNLDAQRFAAYDEFHVMRVEGPLDVAALQQACGVIQQRHALLHSRLSSDGTQWLADSAEVPLVVEAVADEQATLARIAALDGQSFSLDTGLLWRVTFLRLPDGSGSVVVDFHHLIVDGWSFVLLLQELSEAYNAVVEGRTLELSPVVPFAKFVEHQQRWLAGNQAADAARHWQRSVQGYPDRPLPALSSVRSSTVTELVSAADWEAIKATAKQLGVTLSSLLLAAYLPLLWDWRHSDDVVVAVPVSARTFPGSGAIVGYCSHLMPLRLHGERGSSVAELVGAVQRVMVSGLSNQNYPFSRILGDYRRRECQDPSCLTAIGFNLDRYMSVPQLSGLRWHIRETQKSALDYHVNLTVLEHDEGTSLALMYRLAALETQVAKTWIERYRRILDGLVAATPSTPWRKIASAAGVAGLEVEPKPRAAFAFE